VELYLLYFLLLVRRL